MLSQELNKVCCMKLARVFYGRFFQKMHYTCMLSDSFGLPVLLLKCLCAKIGVPVVYSR